MFEGPPLSHFSGYICNNTWLRKSTCTYGLLPTPLLLLCYDSVPPSPPQNSVAHGGETPGIMKIAGNIT